MDIAILCTHDNSTFNTHIFSTGVFCAAKCLECGIKVKAQLKQEILTANNGLSAIKNIENRMRELMAQAAFKQRTV